MDTTIEFSIEWIRGEMVATVTAPNNSKLKNRIIKLSQENPEEVNYIENRDGSICGHIPTSYIVLPRKPRAISDEERERLRDMAKRNAHFNNHFGDIGLIDEVEEGED